ncbi:MAG: hypothetical protein ABIO70_07970 [Pseudomonadota bacterium]
MPHLPYPELPVAPVLLAGLAIAALPVLDQFGLPHPSAVEVVEKLEVSRSRAYELRADIMAALPALLLPPGRPPSPPPATDADLTPILRACRDFVYDHPGAVEDQGVRRRYTDRFHHFILDLAQAHLEVPLPLFADAAGVPLGTLRDWLAGGLEAIRLSENQATAPNTDPTEPQVEQLLAIHAAWTGSFKRFCKHAQQDWRLPFGRTLISTILSKHGVRHAKRRSGRSPDEDALRGQFLTFFPNVQWVGDGTQLGASIGAENFSFNLELLVDPASGAFVGAAVTDTENGAAVIEATQDAVATTGSPPISILLDNKPSNHTDAVAEAVTPAVLERSTRGRPQSKAHIEGGFGLFQQVAPVMALLPTSPRELARQLVALTVTTWARTLNHKPMKDHGGLTRVQRHLDHKPSPEEVQAAKAALRDRLRKQEKARLTRQARQDPQVRAALADAFARFAFDDPEGHLLDAIARYPLGAVVDAIATFDGKRRANTLPEGVDARYLLGIARNIAEVREGLEIALALWRERRAAQDRALDPAERERNRLEEADICMEERIASFVDLALGTKRRLDRFFWLTAIADTVLEQDPAERRPLFHLAARRIHATFAVPHKQRLEATRFLAASILTLD